MRRPLPAALAALLLALVPALVGCVRDAPEGQVVIGAGSTTEQRVLTELTRQVLADRGVDVAVEDDLGGTVGLRQVADGGDIDTWWGSTGAAWALGLQRGGPPVDPQESFEAVAAADAEQGFTWIGPSAVDARLALFTRPDALAADEDPTLTWLAGRLGQQAQDGEQGGAEGDAAVCADAEYLEAESGFAYLTDTYAIAEAVPTIASPEDVALQHVADGRCLAGLATATSGRARELGLVALVDDQGVFPAQVLAPVVVEGGAAGTEVVRDALADVAGSLSTEVVADLNARAGLGQDLTVVAEDAGRALGLLGVEEE